MNVVLIPSIVDTPKTPLSYCETRSVYSRQERFSHMIKTIENIKLKIPNNFIVLVECSLLTKQEEDFFSFKC